jgi:hypothetical protein
MSKIYAEYRLSSVWDLDLILKGLGITADKITDKWVKWDTLHIEYIDADGQEQTAEFEPNITCASNDVDGQYFQHPETVTEE